VGLNKEGCPGGRKVSPLRFTGAKEKAKSHGNGFGMGKLPVSAQSATNSKMRSGMAIGQEGPVLSGSFMCARRPWVGAGKLVSPNNRVK
jgi:hypothetical protein